MQNTFLWVLIASAAGFTVSAIFAGWLKLLRNVYLLIYIPVVAGLMIAFSISNGIQVAGILAHNWYWGLIGAAGAAAFVIRNVFSQPASARNRGPALLLDLIWPGFMYGLMDSLLLSVLPILAVQLTFADAGWNHGPVGTIGLSAVGFLASVVITVAYHLGYPEFRGKKVVWPVIGNGVLTLAYILTGNPMAAILPHIGMHIAAMVHGRETTGQVPPHYND